MIIKTYEINKVKNNSNFYLIYGKNEGLKDECVKEILNINEAKIFHYDEKQVQEEKEIFFENTLSGSLFENNKIIVINRASNKIFEIVEELMERKIDGVKIIINSGILEKKSKLSKALMKYKRSKMKSDAPQQKCSIFLRRKRLESLFIFSCLYFMFNPLTSISFLEWTF